jgi:hypothetical protein
VDAVATLGTVERGGAHPDDVDATGDALVRVSLLVLAHTVSFYSPGLTFVKLPLDDTWPDSQIVSVPATLDRNG